MDVLSIDQVCERLGCKRSRVFQLLADGTLERAPRFGRSLRVFAASVDRALRPPVKRRRAGRVSDSGRLPPPPADLLA